jgi:hypothetical protein
MLSVGSPLSWPRAAGSNIDLAMLNYLRARRQIWALLIIYFFVLSAIWMVKNKQAPEHESSDQPQRELRTNLTLKFSLSRSAITNTGRL